MHTLNEQRDKSKATATGEEEESGWRGWEGEEKKILVDRTNLLLLLDECTVLPA